MPPFLCTSVSAYMDVKGSDKLIRRQKFLSTLFDDIVDLWVLPVFDRKCWFVVLFHRILGVQSSGSTLDIGKVLQAMAACGDFRNLIRAAFSHPSTIKSVGFFRGGVNHYPEGVCVGEEFETIRDCNPEKDYDVFRHYDGSVIERSASSSVMQVGVSSGRERSFQTEYGIRLMLAPRSAKALHVLIPENSHGIRNRPGSPSFFVFSVEANFGIRVKASEIDVRWLGIGALTGSTSGLELDFEIGLELPEVGRLRCFRRGRVPEPEVEAVLEVTNLESMSVKLAIWFCKVWPWSLVSWWLINLGTVNLALVEIVPSVLIVIVSPIEIVLIISLMALNGRKTGRLNLICIHLSSATSDETAGVEELVLTLETMALLRD
ncbi:hypothetical protein Tco_1540071 [Tanacetum coccineum]